MSNYVNTIQDRDGTDYYLMATIPTVTATAESVEATEPVSVEAGVDSDGNVMFEFSIPEASTAAADAAAQTALDAASACDTATVAANAAATGATTAAQNAINATVNTVNATNDARVAISDAESATNAANSAATSATTAANNADNATTSATNAAAGAITAKDNAVTATANANAAATSATNAAGAANTAASYAAQAIADLQAFVPIDADNILKGKESGALVSVDDAYPSPLLRLTVYGNSVQDGTPTPDAPVVIKSVAGGKICTTGENMLYRYQASGNTTTVTGVTATWNDDNSITLTGTNTSSSWAEVTIIANTQRMVLTAGETYSMGLFGNTSDDVDIVVRKNTTSGGAYDGTTSTHKSFIANATAYAVVKVRVRGNATVNNTVYPYLVSGSTTPTEWPTIYLVDDALTPLTLVDDQGVAHELRSLGDYRDELIINADGSGTLIAKSHRATVTSSNISKITNASYLRVSVNVSGHAAKGNIIPRSTHYIGNNNGLAVNRVMVGSNVGPSIWLSYSDFADIDAYKAWLDDGNAPVIDLVLANPETYHIPAINMPALPDLVSNAWVSATDADGAAIACECGVTYRRDINKVIENIENAIADIISA